MAEAEYMELAETAKQAAWLRSFSQEIGRLPTHPTTICADNQATIFLATNPAQQMWIKHMDICYHYIWEQVKDEKSRYVTSQGRITLQTCSQNRWDE